MTAPEVLFDVEDGVGVMMLNRPEKMNAISQNMFDNGIPDIVAQVEADPSIRVFIITGAGGNFCSGADVGRMGEGGGRSVEERRTGLRRTLDWIYRIVNLEKPVISAVDGIAYGGGFSLALTADITFATPRARFCQVFGRIGLIPDMGSGYLLPRIVGERRAKELIFTARTIDAAEAQHLGIVQEIHAPGALMPVALEMARRLAKGSAVSQAQAKQLINQSMNSNQPEMIEAEIEAQYVARSTDFHEEAVRRFMNKEPRLYDWDAMRKADAAE